METFKPFLWPDHNIGKRESRRIREDQNALYNAFHKQRAECQQFRALLVRVLGFEQRLRASLSDGGHALADEIRASLKNLGTLPVPGAPNPTNSVNEDLIHALAECVRALAYREKRQDETEHTALSPSLTLSHARHVLAKHQA